MSRRRPGSTIAPTSTHPAAPGGLAFSRTNCRYEARAHGKLPRGHDLVETMSRYSERGHHYVAELKTIMRQNKLDPIDESKLVEMEIVQLVLVN